MPQCYGARSRGARSGRAAVARVQHRRQARLAAPLERHPGGTRRPPGGDRLRARPQLGDDRARASRRAIVRVLLPGHRGAGARAEALGLLSSHDGGAGDARERGAGPRTRSIERRDVVRGHAGQERRCEPVANPTAVPRGAPHAHPPRFSILNGKRHGPSLQWYENGKLWKKSCFREGKLHGSYEWWYENGRKSIVGTYKNGKEQGVYTEWHENGKKALQTKYINGIPDGKYREWHENGKKRIRITFRDGKENGVWTQWYENGKKEMKVKYVNGIPWGEAFFWFPNGSLQGRGVVKSEVPGGGWILEDEGGKRQVYQPEE